MYPQTPRELVADPKGSTKHSLGNTCVSDKILILGINIRIVICVVNENG